MASNKRLGVRSVQIKTSVWVNGVQINMPQVADPSITVSTTTSDSSRNSSNDGKEGKTVFAFTNIVRGFFTEISAILIIGYLINKLLTYFWSDLRGFNGLPNFWVHGGVIGGIIGLFVVHQLYIRPNKKHP